MKRLIVLCALACACLCTARAFAATPVPAPVASPHFPDRPLHARLIVEVNHMGQVVRVAHGDLTGDRAFDLVVLGNAMQMWIRHPDGTAETGTYSITYDYNPKDHKLERHPEIISRGGAWANSSGAATNIMNDLAKQQKTLEALYKAQKAKSDAEKARNLPDINAAVRRSMSTPTASPHP